MRTFRFGSPDDVIDYRLAFLTKGECPPSGLKPHTDILKEFPYLGGPRRVVLLNHRISAGEQRKGHSEAERFGVPHFLATQISPHER